MIKITIEDIVMMHENMNFLLELNLPASKSYKVGSLVNFIREKFYGFEQKRQDLVRKFGEVNKEKGEVKVMPENMESFSNELRGMLLEEVEFDMNPILVSDLDDVKISTKQMAIFAKIFVE